MCTWGEEQMVPLAIESSKDFVDRYIVVDKPAEDNTVEVVKECKDKWKLNIDIYVKPDLPLQDAVTLGISKVDEDWILFQDGDEVFHTDGPNSIFNLKKLLRFRNVVFYAPMTVLIGDLLHTCTQYTKATVGVHQPPHPFLYHNNHTFYQHHGEFFPGMVGARVYLSKVYKFNCRVKSPKRMFLRLNYWKEWCKETSAFKKYRSVEEYAKAKLGVQNLEDNAKKWYQEYTENVLKPYDEKKYGYYPKVIREHIRKGKIRGHEENRLA